MEWRVAAVIAVPVVLIALLTVAARLGRRGDRSSTLRRFVIFSAGASDRRLRKAQPDENLYLGLGSMVVATSLIAGGSLFLALNVAYETAGIASWVFMFPAGLYSAVIYTVDRFLVSLQMNPVRFPATRNMPTAPLLEAVRPARVLAVLLIAVPRVLVAVLIGFMIAEPALLTLFKDEVDTRVAAIRRELGKDAADGVLASYQDRLDELNEPVLGVSERDGLQKRVDDLTQKVNEKRQLEKRERELANAERDGTGVTVGDTTTTGDPGCLDQCEGHLIQARLAEQEARQLDAQREPLLDKLATLKTQVDTPDQERQAQYRELNDVTIPRKQQEARERAERTGGLLMRIDALSQISSEDRPYAPDDGTSDGNNPIPAVAASSTASSTTAASPSPSPSASTSSGPTPLPSPSSSPRSGEGRHIFGLTTLGLTVWLVRLWLVLLDSLPVLLKVMLALRPRRPYDIVVAEEEEAVLSASAVRVDKLRAASYVTKRNLLLSASEGRPPRLLARGRDGMTYVVPPTGIAFDDKGNIVGDGAGAVTASFDVDSHDWLVDVREPDRVIDVRAQHRPGPRPDSDESGNGWIGRTRRMARRRDTP